MQSPEPASAPRAVRYPHTIAVRLDDSRLILAEALRSATDPPEWSASFRWLLDQPEVRTVIEQRAKGER